MYKFFRILLITIFCFFIKFSQIVADENKIKIGLLIPLTGDNGEIGSQILKATKMALKDINIDQIEIYPKDTQSDPDKTLSSAKELSQMGINLIIGPVFYKNLIYLDEVEGTTFLSFTNKTLDLPKNVISSGVNATSQLNTIKKFLKINDIKKTIFLIPDSNYDLEIIKGIKNSKIKIFKRHNYNIEPTKLTKQIEKITNYEVRKQNLFDEIKRIENSTYPDKDRRIENLNKRYTIGNLKFDSVIIADFEESLKSVITSLLYTDVSPNDNYFITFNQWFDKSLVQEKNIQPIYYPSINQDNLKIFEEKYFNEFKQYPNHLALLGYDLIGLVYYLSLKSDLSKINKSFKSKNSFKGKIGIFDIENNTINHKLNFYQVYEGKLKKIF